MLYGRLVFLLLAVASCASPALADSWAMPSEKVYRSPNGRYQFRVTPKALESQLAYFDDKVKGNPDAGARRDVQDPACRGSLARRTPERRWSKVWSGPLVNEVSPVDALVSNDGRYVVTFDNWHSVGLGKDVVAIYDATGRAIHTFGLEDLLPESYLARLPRSVSSRWWAGRHVIDEKGGLLVLRIVKPGGQPSFEEDSEDPTHFNVMKIELATGRIVEWEPEPWTASRFTVVRVRDAGDDSRAEPTPVGPEWGDCSDLGSSRNVLDLGTRIEAHVATERTPPYPPMASQAWISGEVTVQVLVSESGSVLCARALSGHPLLRPSAVAAAREMTFTPVSEAGNAVKVSGTFVFSYRRVEEAVTDSRP
jgi:TonB family protein